MLCLLDQITKVSLPDALSYQEEKHCTCSSPEYSQLL